MEVEPIERGWSVYTEDNKRVGDVVEVHPHYLLVSRGLVMVRDVYVPRYAVASVEGRKVHLAITDSRLRHMGWTSPPPPPPPPVESGTPRLVPPIEQEPPDLPFFSADERGAPRPVDTLDNAAATDRAPDDMSVSGLTPAMEAPAFASDTADPYATFASSFDTYDDYEDMGVFSGPTIEVDGEAYLAVRRLGEGPAIVLIHGWGFDRRVWDYLTLDLPHDYTVVTYDARGYGASSAPWGGYGIAQASRDLRVLLRTLEIDRATLIGLDVGAAAALHYADSGGRRAGRLVLIAPTVALDTDTETAGLPGPPQAWRDLLRQDRARLATELATVWAPTASPETQAWLRDGLLAAAPHALLHGLETLATPALDAPDEAAGPALGPGLAGIALPTTVLCGRADPVVPLVHAQAVAAAIPGAQFVALETPGHLPMLTDPQQVATAIRAAIMGEEEKETAG